uniref:winged helix-turn-helix domain-containing protein n=1 Tax=Escherichia coli TaxID=562 RepID=UPI00301BBA1B
FSDPGPVFHTIVSIKNDGHYFCRAGGNRPDGLNEPVTIDVAVRRLRSKIDDDFEPKLIHTVRGAGYVLEIREE